MIDMSVNICGVHFKNPVIAASGTYAFGKEYDELYPIDLLGGISVKGLTLKPRKGNPPNRIAQTPSGMLNAVGLQNPGVENFIEDILPGLIDKDIVVIANVAGNSIDEYTEITQRISCSDVHIIELNVSCPNVKQGCISCGTQFGVDPQAVYEVTRAVKSAAKKPLIIKLSPNTTDIKATALAAQEGGADGISLINTITGMAIDIHSRRPVLKNITGGLSGPAIMPVALRMVYEVCGAVSIPVIGMGGISTGGDAAAFMLAGASAIMVGTANLYDPMACPRIIDELKQYAQSQGEQSISALTGGLKLS